MPWIDRLKALAILWIVLNHIVERLVGGAYAGNPSVPWPPLRVRIAQFAPVHGAGLADWPLTVLRDLGWFGDQGVTLFLILSGFGLTWGLLRSKNPDRLDVGAFYRRRFDRILPLWWGVNVLFLLTGIVFERGLSLGDWQFYPSLAGLRFIPGVFYYYAPAWWFIGLIVQLYFAYPLLYRVLRARGPLALLGLGCGVGFVSIALGPYLFHDAYLDAWQRGAFFVTRLPDFTLGMVLAAWWSAAPARVEALLASPLVWLAALAAYVAGTALSFTLSGMIVAPALLGASAFVLLFPLVRRPAPGDGAFRRLGRDSYALYLVHDPLVRLFVHSAPGGKPAFAKVGLGIVLALVATLLATALLMWGVGAAERALARIRARRGTGGVVAAVAAFVFVIVGVPLAADRAVAAFAPEEVQGWGERTSLEPSQRFGWRLIPDRTTRLRWQSYDYNVTANALGFPGPAFGRTKPPGTFRILVTGDAFASAEGVDTNLAWPRLLQNDLERSGRARNVEVLNFAITGYGPNQEAAVVRAFVPQFHPDLVLIEMFANDVDDQLTSNDAFRKSIGFDNPAPGGWQSILSLQQLHTFVALRIVAPLEWLLRRKPSNEGYFLGNFRFLERGRTDYDAGVRGAIRNYEAIARAAHASGARTIVAFVPAPVEVCDRKSLAYYPGGIDIDDASKFDRDLPDERARRIAAAAGVPLWNLRPVLRAQTACPYMPRNMHFTAAGHAAVAAWLARRIAALR